MQQVDSCRNTKIAKIVIPTNTDVAAGLTVHVPDTHSRYANMLTDKDADVPQQRQMHTN